MRAYHHGNLREALVSVGLELIAERGNTGFTNAEIARAVGVSPAAPYRHFRDRNELIAEIGRRGYALFEEALITAWDGGRPDPVSAIEQCGRAYLSFAREHRAYYTAMFEPGFALEEVPALLTAAERAFGVIRMATEHACSTLPREKRPPALMVALHIWSMAHGIASLFVGRQDHTRRKLPMTPEELLEAGLLIYFQSLGLQNSGDVS
ncbi:Transcriptional regulator, TetR family [Granulibacter bethesdensis]|uniref:TetR/AcrR family transcriptional regulator n=1 Tax=Granulibacter bethesdensis TaxID=364410 RepID=UPI00090A893E|nr:TetR/AcrR family transcriptional regulator [Granulibacter bethesdensis]APH56887.1 Transcriptional regulator, TetR family [Granulibacter bethesdensis]